MNNPKDEGTPAEVARRGGRRMSTRAALLAAALLGPVSAASAEPAATDASARSLDERTVGAGAQPEHHRPPPPRSAPPPLAPRAVSLEVVGRALSVGGLITATVGAAVLTVALFSSGAACAENESASECAGSSADHMLAGGAITLSVGGLLLIGGVILTEVATPSGEQATSSAPEFVAAPGGAGLGWRF